MSRSERLGPVFAGVSISGFIAELLHDDRVVTDVIADVPSCKIGVGFRSARTGVAFRY